ncbi:hypothetical protein DFP72DRAFT_103401 [Ephemerocybe angulata]|uniref:Uncharacterized protein n=1 Tax=Ephemerocybe angulata TaxID=980116 RepID=A0A8H6MC05_9AGAR|nr:hypothetical protein DFP72DRAFT_103401 [Tulosesus angulatus]
MATTLPLHNPARPDTGSIVHTNLYPRSFMTEFDLQDNRYPTLARPRQHQTNPSTISSDIPYSDQQSVANRQTPSRQESEVMEDVPLRSPDLRHELGERVPSRSARSPDTLSKPLQSSQSQDTQSYPSQEDMPRRDLDARNRNQDRNLLSQGSLNGVDQRPRSYQESSTARTNMPASLRMNGTMDRPVSMLPNTPRHPDVVVASHSPPGGGQLTPIMPLSASPNYNPPIAPRNRTYPQQPTYINPQNMSNPVNAVYTPMAPPQEEVCLECAMRDQDMADVDVTTPGVWDRASDVQYEELKLREREDEANGVQSDEKRPRARGGRLTEQNLKLWLSINPREPASRMQTLNTYVRSQRALLEAEAVAHAKAMQEAAQLDNRMRDTYSQLRRSAYDIGNASSPMDDTGGVRIKPPTPTTSPMYHTHNRSQSRGEVTLLENGMIVEHVDVRKEEREARERRRKEEKRARKPSRSSVMDASIISGNSAGPMPDVGLKPYSAYSHSGSARPVSELTGAHDRPELPRAYSQASFSDVHSLGSASPRRPKFFGMRNLSTGWRSQDSLAPSFAPSGMSGSMVDMHVALQREDRRRTVVSNNPNSSRLSSFWSSGDPQSDLVAEEKAKKKKSGLIKWWRAVTGSNKPDAQNRNRAAEDDMPLAPPPPLSYLVNRGSAEGPNANGRHASSPSTPSASSPKFSQSITVPSPTSHTPPSPRGDPESSDGRTVNGYDESRTEKTDDASNQRLSVYAVASEPNLRQAATSREPAPPVPPLPESRLSVASVTREKSLPPIPRDEAPALPTVADRPMTMYTYDSRALPPGTRAPHDFLPPNAPFRSVDNRRQSFGGTASRPDLMVQTVPARDGFSIRPPSFGPQYDEFGRSWGSFNPGELEDDRFRATSASPQPSTTKRKSKFGFASLLGKKNTRESSENSSISYGAPQPFPSMGRYDETMSSNARMSMVSRKPLESLVAQDPEFVAYRYPSGDQRLDLLK